MLVSLSKSLCGLWLPESSDLIHTLIAVCICSDLIHTLLLCVYALT